jgi:hypothetical protein
VPGRLVGHVVLPEQRVAAGRAEAPGERVAGGGVDVGQDDCGTLAHEQLGLGGPLPASGAGDQRYFARKPGHFHASLRLRAG